MTMILKHLPMRSWEWMYYMDKTIRFKLLKSQIILTNYISANLCKSINTISKYLPELNTWILTLCDAIKCIWRWSNLIIHADRRRCQLMGILLRFCQSLITAYKYTTYLMSTSNNLPPSNSRVLSWKMITVMWMIMITDSVWWSVLQRTVTMRFKCGMYILRTIVNSANE
jgi:hypothetical protein